MKKILLTLCLTSFQFANAVILTQDIGVKAKDIQKAADTIKMMQSVYKQMSDLKGNIGDVSKVSGSMKTILNNKFVKEFCYGCSEDTIENLEKYKVAEAKNWCDMVNQQLNFIDGTVNNISQVEDMIRRLPEIVGGGDPSAIAAMFNMATASTVDNLNRTQSQMMSYTMAKERNAEIDAKLSQLKANKAMFGTTCPECINITPSKD